MRRWIALGLVAATPALFLACGDSGTPDTLCDPGTFIFCRCPDGEEGSRKCNADGQSFQDCALQDGDACPDRPPAGCGNGVVDDGEECDDGNVDDDDACTSLCLNAICGDTFVESGVEQCDDGNDDDTDGCHGDCTAGVGCGNGMVDTGEDCDDGNSNTHDACVQCHAATCGDGFFESGVEQCDDGNLDGGDGCEADCTLPAMSSYACPGAPLAVGMGSDTTVTGDTSVGTNENAGSCGGQFAPEIVYAVTPTEDGNLLVTMDGHGDPASDPVLYAASDDCLTGPILACSDNTFGGGAESIIFAVAAGTTYYVFADGYDGTTGPYSLNLHLQNGVPGDQCPGLPVTISGTSDVYLGGDTSLANGGGGTSYKGTDACATSASTQDVVYSVTPTAICTLSISEIGTRSFTTMLRASAPRFETRTSTSSVRVVQPPSRVDSSGSDSTVRRTRSDASGPHPIANRSPGAT
jgi:cysteine-rich repeat protein